MYIALSRLLWPVLLVCLAPVVFADTASDSLLRVELTGLENAKGNIYIAVYDSDDHWLGDDTVMDRQVNIEHARDGELVYAELRLPPGEYALSVFYDSNDNGELDTNFIGIPKEPIALSNNARPRFGPPKYKDAVFTLGSEPLTQRIAMDDL